MKQLMLKIQAIWRFNRLWPILLASLLALDLSLYVYLNTGVAPRLEQEERSFIELQARARQAQQVNASAKSPREAFRKAQADLERFNQRIPDRADLSALVGDIYGFAMETGLDIKAIRYQPKKSKGRELLEYPLTFAVSGDYRQVKEFIYQIEQSPRLIAIDKLSLDYGNRDEGNVKLSISMTTYFRLEEA